MKLSLRVIAVLLAAMLAITLIGCKSAEERAQAKYQQAQIDFGSG